MLKFDIQFYYLILYTDILHTMILYFNPGHETAVLNTSPYYTAPANIVAMQQELSFLPAWYGRYGDTVLTGNTQNGGYYSSLYSYFPALPKAIIEEELLNSPYEEVSFWGISPQAVHLFEELSEKYEIHLEIPKWKNEYIYLNSRQAAKDCLQKLTDKIPQLSSNIIPVFYTNLEEIEKAVNTSSFQLLAKAPYSSSGRGLLWLPQTGLTRTERQILHGTLKKQGSVSIEQVLDKDTDFAMEFISDGQGNITFEGYSLFFTNKKGAYSANYIGNQNNILTLLSDKVPLSLLQDVEKQLTEILKNKYATQYKGCIGIDMMIYKDGNEYKLQPCLEINMRYNMGYLSLKLYENYIHSHSQGKFYLDFNAKEGEIYKKHMLMQQEHPNLFENQRLKYGYLSLCPVNEKSRYWAYILIEN